MWMALVRVLFTLSSLVLIALIAARTTKSELGLTGTIGGTSSQSYVRTRVSMEEQLSRMTRWVAVVWLVTAILMAKFS